MSLPASAVERKKAEANENTFVIRPAIRKRFPAPEVREVIRAVFKDRLTAVEVKGESKTDSKIEAPKYSSDMAKDLADNIRNRLKALDLPRYKILVHVVVGESRGEGVRVGTRCLWDTTTDSMVHESFTNDAIFAVATAYGVYLY